MTVESPTNKSGPFIASGATGVFPRNFLVFDPAHVRVVRSRGGIETDITTGISHSGMGSASGTVTLSQGIQSGDRITLLRKVPNVQRSDYSAQASVPTDQVELDLDLLAMQVQDLAERQGRALTLPVDSTVDNEAAMQAVLDAPRYAAEAKTASDAVVASIIPSLGDLIASTRPFATGLILSTRAEGHSYEVVVSGGDMVTAAGVHLRVLPRSGGYDASAFGVRGDGQMVSATMASGSRSLTAAGASFRAGDIGKIILVWDAGLLGPSRILRTTITDVASPTSITLADAAARAVSAVEAIYGTDDTAASNRALQRGAHVRFGPGRHLCGEIVINKRGARIIGSGMSDYEDIIIDPSYMTIFSYCGAGGANSVVVRASKEPVGTDPIANGFQGADLLSTGAMDFVVDGNHLAEYGLYTARCGTKSTEYGQITARRTVRCGIWIGENWSSSISGLCAFENLGEGIDCGRDTFGWGRNRFSSTLANPRAIKNGLAKEFTEATETQAGRGHGLGLYTNLGLCVAPHCENNDGPGIYWRPNGNGIGFHLMEPYTERNGQAAVTEGRASKHWGLWYNSGGSGAIFNKVTGAQFGQSPVGASPATYEWVRLTGAGPGSFPEGSLEFNVLRAGGISADWSGYRLIDAWATTRANIIGQQPRGGGSRIGDGFAVSAFRFQTDLDFPSIAAGSSSDLSVTIPGVTTSDAVIGIRRGDGLMETGIVLDAWVSGPNTVKVRAANVTSTAINPSLQTVYIVVAQLPNLNVIA